MKVVTEMLVHSDVLASQKNPISTCTCTEKVMFREKDEVILKCRIAKIVNGKTWAKCKRCGQWVPIPLKM